MLFQVVTSAPWDVNDKYLTAHKIDFVAHDDIPYASEESCDIYAHIKSRGMFVATERTDGVSTSDIVARIVRDYDLYARRNLARGYSAKELNVSFLKEKKYRLQNKMDELKDRGKKVMSGVTGDILTKWEEKSREFVDTFIQMFGRGTNMWDSTKGRLMQALSPPASPNTSPRNSPRNSINGHDSSSSSSGSDGDSPSRSRSRSTTVTSTNGKVRPGRASDSDDEQWTAIFF